MHAQITGQNDIYSLGRPQNRWRHFSKSMRGLSLRNVLPLQQ